MNINITNNAWNKIIDILKKSNNKYGFLYSASSGGCNGFNFELDLIQEKEFNKLDNLKYKTILSNNNYNVYVDPLSELYLLNTTIDYISEDYSKGNFENKFVFNVDKTLLSTCGCGVSFNIK